jgi:predicted nucleic acid-binding Zn ribbon protein
MESLGAAIAKMLKLYNIEKPVQQNEALILWNDIVGKTISRHTTPEKIMYSKLFIRVDSPVWRNELNFRKAEILKKLNNQLKNAQIKEIVLR